jgi:glycosyltransferase involved in cell wall biosynthesis
MSAQPTVSIILLARDEADRIGPCLESAAWADEVVVVVDAATTDDTADICRRAGAKVTEQAWQGFSAQWQTALDAATCDWIFMMAADERITPELAGSIRAAVGNAGDYTGFEAPIGNLFWGRILRCRYPDYHLRLFRRGAGHISKREVHEGWEPDDPAAKIGRLTGDLIHDSYRDLSHYMQKMLAYAELGARQIVKTRKIRSIRPAILNALVNFLKYQVLKGGFRDGAAGFVYNMAHTIYVFHKYAKAYELTMAAERDAKDKEKCKL